MSEPNPNPSESPDSEQPDGLKLEIEQPEPEPEIHNPDPEQPEIGQPSEDSRSKLTDVARRRSRGGVAFAVPGFRRSCRASSYSSFVILIKHVA
jgi:hypothetical protein